jgi:hypothetical protein
MMLLEVDPETGCIHYLVEKDLLAPLLLPAPDDEEVELRSFMGRFALFALGTLFVMTILILLVLSITRRGGLNHFHIHWQPHCCSNSTTSNVFSIFAL